LLAHTIYQALAFDAALVEEGFSLANGEEWKGISDVILGRPEWFEKWLDGEKQCMNLNLRGARSPF
jgi:RAD50-interacting protein 1